MTTNVASKKPLRILHVEDSARDAELIRERLTEAGLSMQLDWAANEEQFTSYLRQGVGYDLILADYHFSTFDGLAALHLAQSLRPGVPFICVSGAIGEEKAVELLKQGAIDFVSKDHLARLPISVQRAFEGATERAARQQAQQALQASEERYGALLRTAMDGFWLVDVRGRLLEVNETYCRMSGYSAEELRGMHVADVEAIESPAAAAAHLQRLMERGEDRFESRHRRKDKTEFDVEVSVQYRPGDGGQLVVFLRDITQNRRLEEQLRQAQKMEAIGQLAGGVAHDFNNVLMVILGYCNLLDLRPELDPGARLDLSHINAAAEKAAQLTRGLLAFSRKQVMDPKPVNLNDVVQQVQKFLVRVIGENITLKTIYNDATLRVVADAGQLEQVLVNLATNARDAMPGGGTLVLETAVADLDEAFVARHGCGHPGQYAVITVTDTGVGMSAETQERIFEPFFTTKAVGKGTGLGMSIVHGIVTQHNGFIGLESSVGKGATFTIYLPRLEKIEISPAPSAAPVRAKGGTETILVVEDDAIVGRVMRTVLANSGYTVIGAEDGVEAVEQFTAHQEHIALVLMDMIMPRKSGMDACREIRQIRPEVKVLFTSGYTADFIRNQAELEDGIDLMMKPVRPHELLGRVRKLLDERNAP